MFVKFYPNKRLTVRSLPFLLLEENRTRRKISTDQWMFIQDVFVGNGPDRWSFLCFWVICEFSGTMIPKSGGDYAYISDAFGPLPAFLYLWVALFILVPTGNAITALTFAQYILQPIWLGCTPPYTAVRLLAAVITCKSNDKTY